MVCKGNTEPEKLPPTDRGVFFPSMVYVFIWVKVFKNGLNTICERQPLQNLN